MIMILLLAAFLQASDHPDRLMEVQDGIHNTYRACKNGEMSKQDAIVKINEYKKQVNLIAPRTDLFHTMSYEDFDRYPVDGSNPWMQVFLIAKDRTWSWANITGSLKDVKDVMRFPSNDDTHEKSRLYRTSSGEGAEYQVNTSSTSQIRSIKAYGGDRPDWLLNGHQTAGGDDWIMVTFSDGGKIWYKQPRWERGRDYATTWIQGKNYGVAQLDGHSPAPGKYVSDYADELMILRPRAVTDAATEPNYQLWGAVFKDVERGAAVVGAAAGAIYIGVAGTVCEAADVATESSWTLWEAIEAVGDVMEAVGGCFEGLG